MIQAIFFDMDGTLVSYPEAAIPASALRAIAALRSQGIHIFIATGRHRLELEDVDFLHTVTPDAVAALNGQYCYTPTQDLLIQALEPADVTAFCRFSAEHPIPSVIAEPQRIYVNFVNEGFRAALRTIATDPPPVGDLTGIEQRAVLQLVPYCDADTLAGLMRRMPAAKATRWSPDFVDIIHKRGGKVEGCAAILEHFGLTWAETMAFGDGQNDIGMLEHAAISVAMGNADPAVKQCASYVTADAGRDGIAQALKHFHLI